MNNISLKTQKDPYQKTIDLFRRRMEPGKEYGVIYGWGGLQDYYPVLVRISRPIDIGSEWIGGILYEITGSRESLGNAAGPASVVAARIAKAIGALDAEAAEEAIEIPYDIPRKKK